MKINTLTIKKIIKEELDCVIKEFKMPDIIPTPESMGFERIVIDPSFESKAKEMLSNVDVKGLREFLKQNFPMEALTLKESIEKNLPRRKRTASEIITENVKIMKADKMWQENFDQNIQELIQISKEDPSQKELIDEWVKIFVFEKSKTWFDKNTPTIKAFIKNNYKRLESFIKNNYKRLGLEDPVKNYNAKLVTVIIAPIVVMVILELIIFGTHGNLTGIAGVFAGFPLVFLGLILLKYWDNK